MPLQSHAMLIESERAHMQQVYCQLESNRNQARNAEDRSRTYAHCGPYDDVEKFIHYGELNRAVSKRNMADKLCTILYRKPYFAHLEAQINSNQTTHYFLSDCELLDEAVLIDAPQSKGMLVPFKQDKKRPVSSALFHSYQAHDGKAVPYSVCTDCGKETFVLHPVFICDDTIENRELVDAVQLFPEAELLQINADELLEAKLDENRNNPVLRNIIATLQQQQFRIIETDIKTDFVVQGCAGSGKSQCLLHRLFYLRDELSQDKWNHVLLLTPTQLFRNYSSELMRRYSLSDIHNSSLAELYKDLLSAYDPRFKNRQYKFELSEEYLPDSYLQSIYNPLMIQRIDAEINATIEKYVHDGCSALGINTIDKVDADAIAELVSKLDAAIEAFDSREKILSLDAEYEARKKEYEQLQKALVNTQKNLDRMQKDQDDCHADIEKIEQLILAVKEAKDEISHFSQDRKKKYTAAQKNLSNLETALKGHYSPDIPARYAHQLYIVSDLTSGATYEADEEYLAFLRAVEADAEKELNTFAKGQAPERAVSRLQKKQKEQTARIDALKAQLESGSTELEQCTNWLKEKAGELEGEKSKIVLQRTEMDRARYFLSRIESTIFEQVVWNAVLPLKEWNGVKALDITIIDDTHQRETRILYKSDLLFYIRVYARLHSSDCLPDYRLLCIDEGQDLHKADYDTLRSLFPRAVFNVFGDTAQVLHSSCGIHDWRAETGISMVYSLNRNYRNTAAIVDFCNGRFKAGMDAVGKVRREQYPTELEDISSLRNTILTKDVVVIVRDFQCFKKMCTDTGVSPDTFEFLDTKATKPEGKKKVCYSIFAAKGLEFPSVVVYSRAMTTNQKVVACTRAMEVLYYYE